MVNSGTISDLEKRVDLHRLSKFVTGKNTLVTQGGGQRGIFTAGVLDAFILSNFDPFHEFYGTSAGALNLCAYLCRQHGLGKAFILELTTDPQFFHLFSYIRRKQPLNLDWALDKICHYPYRLDLDMGRSTLGTRKAFAAVTDLISLKDAYFPMLGNDWREILTATCAIPGLYTNNVSLGGRNYIDGGVSASIPVQEAWRQEARFITVIRTETLDEESQQNVLKNVPSGGQVPWLRESFNSIQTHWQNTLLNWKQDWKGFLQQQIVKSQQLKQDHPHLEVLNGGRWLFGADNIYRLSHLLGNKFDSGLADMLMVHYQTYALTSDFLHSPPDDVFIVQIVPSKPLKSSSLLSRHDDLLHDYELGLQAGYEFIETFLAAKEDAEQRQTVCSTPSQFFD
ncbi:patatin-like phospholipase family protein [Vibrio cincinnatiensis]|uniref:patatin-like phospholipase family protein n=1 Tax=Vibrio cincinnatiensis TaxID=675 RepID=UPI001EE08663|nr:patatin-like phospholipase family protein [Vibrio cincinnatiensis]MCG3722906.1 patatin family protein [Vibrio cincinnatiensis]MCG3724658.1 patatin family protein [Vibrio cincinnatiensis]MCG3731695.1 patatin family protein [Vibrio cincinnatiensis]MCG3736914.1 patatin family protein [Vibrio cincinnatiensis]MCG3738321.1 patatin family protein [Vibrio cincinnatiensis]